MKTIVLGVSGMTCSACSNGLEKYLNKQSGIYLAVVNLVLENVQIEYDETILDRKKIEKMIEEAGFSSTGIYQEQKQEGKDSSFSKLIIMTTLAILLMLVSMGHMFHISLIDKKEFPILYIVTLMILTISFLIYGKDILKSGVKNLYHRMPNMDTLVSIGVWSSLLYSIYHVIRILQRDLSSLDHLYFESAAFVIYFVKLGRNLDHMSKEKTKEAIQQLVQITPSFAIIKKDGKEVEVTLDEIKKGDILIAKPGSKIAVDGVVISGTTHVDEAFLTGESKPIKKEVESKVIAGSINYDGYIEYEAQRIGKDSTISEIVRLVVEATASKAPIAKIADRISGYFVFVVFGLALIALLGNLLFNPSFAITSFVSVLVVACPCSLGLATPLAIVVSEGLCASHGILVKKSEVLENANKVTAIVFDKTGTLTYGTLKIKEIKNYSKLSTEKLLQLVGSLEKNSTHPIARAFTTYLEEHQLITIPIDNYQEESGLGISGEIDGKKILLGNAKMLKKHRIKNKHLEEENQLTNQGNSILYVVEDQKILALIGVNDVIRTNAKEVIQELSKRNILPIMLTGDNEKTAQVIAKEIGITEVIANVSPKEKTKQIEKYQEEGYYVMMCGDGINDSPALATSNIGISISQGTDIAKDSADVILTKNDLNSILNLLTISQKTLRIIKQNLFWAFFYNILMIPIAMGLFYSIGIKINPMLASIAMIFSSFTVTLNALRLKKIKLER